MTAQELMAQFRYCKLIFASDGVGYCWLADYYEEPQVGETNGEEALFVTYGDGCMSTYFKAEVEGDKIKLLEKGMRDKWFFRGHLVIDTEPRDEFQELQDELLRKKRIPSGVSDGSGGCYN
jgi:hypothetical protein